MTVCKIISRAKFEGNQNASTQYDTWALETVQEELLNIHQKHNYQNIVKDTILTVTAGVGYISLPSDFLRLASGETGRLKFYTDGAEDTYRFLTRASTHNRSLTDGEPSHWEIKNNRLYFYPYSDGLGTHRIAISYYAAPAEVELNSEIQDDWAVIILNRLIARLLRMKDSKQAETYNREAKEKFIDSV